MPLAGKVARVALFLGVVLLVVAVTTAGSFVAGVTGPPPEPAEYPEYNASSIVPERADAGGAPAVEPVDDAGLIVVDLAHANRVHRDEIQPLTAAIAGTGAEVEYLRGGDDLGTALARADALVVIDPGTGYTTGEADRVEEFVERGGRLALLGEPSRLGTAGSPTDDRLGSLSTRFGLEFGADYLYNMERNDGNFRSVIADADGDGPLADGVDSAAFHVAAPVEGRDAEPVLVAGAGTQSSRTDAAGEYAVAARAGDVVAVGDTSFLGGGSHTVLDTEAFVANLATFLASGERERTLLEYPAVVDEDPTVRYTAPELLDAAQALRETAPGRATLAQSAGGGPGDADVLVTTFSSLDEQDLEGTGIDVSGDRVSVPGYRSETAGVAVVRAPADGELDLVIAADDPARALRAAERLAEGTIDQFVLDDRTAVLRGSGSTGGAAGT